MPGYVLVSVTPEEAKVIDASLNSVAMSAFSLRREPSPNWSFVTIPNAQIVDQAITRKFVRTCDTVDVVSAYLFIDTEDGQLSVENEPSVYHQVELNRVVRGVSVVESQNAMSGWVLSVRNEDAAKLTAIIEAYLPVLLVPACFD
ncbi:MAG: hypothetical protein H7Y11_12545 [Armatimonadetes bacterium]|nr:hypothetical protein [Anaerolineae bacterium]